MDGSVLTPLLMPSALLARVRPNVRLRGAATLDATALGQDELRWTGALRTDGHRLDVTGTKGILFGAADMSAIIDYPVYDVPDVAFAAADATGLAFTNQVTLIALPPADACDAMLAHGLMAALRGTNTLARFYVDGALDLADWDVTLLESLAAHDTPIRVHGGRTLVYKYCTWANNSDWRWSGTDGGAYTNTIELLSDANGDAVLKSLGQQTFNLYGAVSGTGQVVQAAATTWSQPQFRLHGPCTQKGAVKIVDGTGELVFFEQTSPGDSANPVDLSGGSIFACHAPGYGGRATDTYLEDVTGQWANDKMAQIAVANHETVTVGTLRGTVLFSCGGSLDGHVVVSNNLSTGFWIKGVEHLTVVDVGREDAALRVQADGKVLNPVLRCEDCEHAWKHLNIEKGVTLVFEGTGVVTQVKGEGGLRLAPGAKLTVDAIDPSVVVDAAAGGTFGGQLKLASRDGLEVGERATLKVMSCRINGVKVPSGLYGYGSGTLQVGVSGSMVIVR